ncbi:hypothetical protein N7522_006854, partial [Penicillium canescens]
IQLLEQAIKHKFGENAQCHGIYLHQDRRPVRQDSRRTGWSWLVPTRVVLNRNPETESSVASSVSTLPFDSTRQSPSSTSLSSISSKQGGIKMLDTYGNEFKIPEFIIKQIRDAIPARCFHRSATTSLYYVFRDIAILAAVFYLFNHYVTPEYVPFAPLRAVLWTLYTVIQGMVGTGVWVLAHECGHQAFSPSKVLNDTVGWICHSALLVPYFSWKISHGKHHKAVDNIARDMVFVPKTREQYASRVGKAMHELGELTEETPILTASNMILNQLFGWPGPLYKAKDAKLIILSDLGLFITGSVLYYIGSTYGWLNLLVWYGIPYLWVNHWLLAITFLQHTDPTLPHYQPEVWNFARGAAATIDRDFGFVGRHIFHVIIETHVLHHYVSNMPFHNAGEASEAIKGVMGTHYCSQAETGWTGFLKALWTSARVCQWVEPTDGAKDESQGVLFYRNTNGIGVPPSKMTVPAN